MIAEKQTAIHNVGLLLVQRGGYAISGLLFAALVPRLMGPETYGRYALVHSLALWFLLCGSLGFTQVITRYVPHFALQKDWTGLQTFFGNLLVLRLGSAALAAGLYLLLASLWLHDLDIRVLMLVATTVLVRAVSHFCFALFLGLNQAARWGLGDLVHRWVLLVLLPVGFSLGGLQGACLGLLITDLVVLALGLRWGRTYLSWAGLRLHVRCLTPYVRLGLVFFASNLLLATLHRSGQALVRAVTGDYVQVSYFTLAHDAYLMVATTIPQLTMACVPFLTLLLVQGQTAALRQWIEQLLKWLAMGGVLIVLGALLLGEDLVPLVLGSTYRPVAANLLILTLILLLLALNNATALLALLYDRPGMVLTASGIQLAAFWGLGPPLVSAWGSLGGCLAVLVASGLHAGYLTWRAQGVLRYSLHGWARVIGVGALCLPLAWLRASWLINVALYGAGVAGYLGVLLLFRMVSPEELGAVWRIIRLGNRPLRPNSPKRHCRRMEGEAH